MNSWDVEKTIKPNGNLSLSSMIVDYGLFRPRESRS